LYIEYNVDIEAPTPGKKAAATSKRSVAAKKAAATRKHRAAGKKAAKTLANAIAVAGRISCPAPPMKTTVFLANKILAFSLLVFRNITTFFQKPQAEIPVDTLARRFHRLWVYPRNSAYKRPRTVPGPVGF